jgi:hypothetical protein
MPAPDTNEHPMVRGVTALEGGVVLTTDIVEGRGRRRRVSPFSLTATGLRLGGHNELTIPWRDVIDSHVERGRLRVSYGDDRRHPHELRVPLGEAAAMLFAEEIVRRRRDAAFVAATTRLVPEQRAPQ